MSCCYLLHFKEKYKHTQHYIGWTTYLDPWRRVAHHRAGRGARFTKAVTAAGIEFVVARIWVHGDRQLERELKKKHRAKDLCPICNKKEYRHLIRRKI